VNASSTHLPPSRIARILAKAVKLTTVRMGANYSSETINIRDDSSSRKIGTSWMSTATKEKPALFSREQKQ
jgi:hypothetical protein